MKFCVHRASDAGPAVAYRRHKSNASRKRNQKSTGQREPRTEHEIHRKTDEHPLWVQGKSGTPAKEVTDEDVLGTQRGDALVLSNRVNPQSATVYNFSVAQTPNYFVGRDGLWAHNARCEIIPGGSNSRWARQ